MIFVWIITIKITIYFSVIEESQVASMIIYFSMHKLSTIGSHSPMVFHSRSPYANW